MEMHDILGKPTTPISPILFEGKLRASGSVASFSSHHHSHIIRTVIIYSFIV